MEKKPQGIISLAYASLKLHIQTLLDEVGGEKACQLLDVLAEIQPKQRDQVIEAIVTVLKRLPVAPSAAKAEGSVAGVIENELYKEISRHLAPKLEVVSGGGSRPSKEPISLEEARKNRASRPTLH